MNKVSSVNLISIIIGAISICVGLYSLFAGEPFDDYFYPLFLGVTITGSSYISYRQASKKKAV